MDEDELLKRLSQQLKLAKQKTDRLTRQIRQATVPAAGVAPDNNVDAGTSSNAKVRQERAMAFLEEAPPLDPKRSEMLTASIFAAAVGIDKWAVPRSLWEKLTEHPNCRPADVFQGNEDTQRGHALEPTARRAYECQFGILAPPCGLHTHCDPTLGWLGCTPDGLIGADGLLEIKSPRSPPTPIVPEHYMAQIQGQLEVTDRAWCDFVCYHPERMVVINIPRCSTYWAWLRPRLETFWRHVQTKTPLPPEFAKQYTGEPPRESPWTLLFDGRPPVFNVKLRPPESQIHTQTAATSPDISASVTHTAPTAAPEKLSPIAASVVDKQTNMDQQLGDPVPTAVLTAAPSGSVHEIASNKRSATDVIVKERVGKMQKISVQQKMSAQVDMAPGSSVSTPKVASNRGPRAGAVAIATGARGSKQVTPAGKFTNDAASTSKVASAKPNANPANGSQKISGPATVVNLVASIPSAKSQVATAKQATLVQNKSNSASARSNASSSNHGGRGGTRNSGTSGRGGQRQKKRGGGRAGGRQKKRGGGGKQ